MDDENWKDIFCSIRLGECNTFLQSSIDAGLDVNALNNNGTTMLSYAAECGNLETIEFLVQKGADGNITNSDGSKPLHIAAKYGHKDIVTFFLNLGVLVDSCDNDNWTPLHYVAGKTNIPVAARESYLELIHFLANNADLNGVNRNGSTPLLLAARHSHEEMVELLIQLGANIECCDERQWTLLHHSSRRGLLGIIRSLVEGSNMDLNAKTSKGYTPLIIAADSSEKDVVKLLIESGADIECKGFEDWTALHYACEEGWLDVVKSLVNKGCNLDAKSSSEDIPLFLAAMHEHSSVVEYLIESGVDVECCDDNEWTVLHYACELGWLDIVKSLIEKRTDINAQDYKYNTPLHVAVQAYDLVIIEHLLKAGADYNLENSYGTTAFNDFIQSYICVEGVKLFLENGAYFQSEDYVSISAEPLLKEGILQDMKLCTQAVINKFNNADLPKIYEIPVVAESLPSIEKLKIASHSNVAQNIAQSVMYEIQTKEYCNVLDVRPIVLNVLCVRSLVEHS